MASSTPSAKSSPLQKVLQHLKDHKDVYFVIVCISVIVTAVVLAVKNRGKTGACVNSHTMELCNAYQDSSGQKVCQWDDDQKKCSPSSST